MALSPDEIEGREFELSRRGYDCDEVDDFLVTVAQTVRDVQAASASESPTEGAPPAAPDETTDPLRSRLDAGPSDTDDFGRLGAEVAAVLRSADEGAARRRTEAEGEATRIRDEADGYAHRLRVETEAEAERVRAEADVEARNARTALDEAAEQARVTVQQAEEQAEALTLEAERNAGVRRQELLAAADRQTDQAASIERDVHGRLLSARHDLDQAVTRLDPEATTAAAAVVSEQASALDPADIPDADDDDADVDAESLLGQGPPTPPVPPPPSRDAFGVDADNGGGPGDLPYAAEDEPLDEPTAGEVIDLTDERTTEEAEEDTIPPVPPPPPPPPGYDSAGAGVTADDLPYAEADDDDSEADTVIDLRDDDPEERAEGDSTDEAADGDGDPLAAMVRDAVGKAVQGAMRRRPGADG